MYKKIQLSNGLRLILLPQKETQSTTILVLFATGSKYETRDINGISHFLEHMFFKGTAKRPNALAVSEALDRVGGEYNAFTAKEYTGYYAKVAPEYINTAFDWMADILLNSKFDAGEIEREKGVIIEEINMYLDNPMAQVGNVWEKLLYGDQPAGWETIGTKETVASFSREQIAGYFKKHYQTGSTVICVSGSLPQNIEQLIHDYFNELPAGAGGQKASVREEQDRPAVSVFYKETDQIHLCLGARSYGLNSPDRYVLSVLSAILGGMMSSRMFISLREEKGLAYYVRTGAEKYTDSGYLMTQAGVTNEKIKEAIKAILAEYKKIRDEKIGQDEIKKAKDHLKGTTRLNLETSDQIASWIGVQEILEKQILTPQEVFAKIEAVSGDDLSRVAGDIFCNEKLNLALIGPLKEEAAFEKLLKI